MSAKWTILVYMKADDGLAAAALANIEDMCKVAIDPHLHVVVQLQTRVGTTARYRIRHGEPERTPLHGNVNMGDPKTVTEFVDWARGAYPAERTALVVWGHGGGWEDEVADERLGSRPSSVRTKEQIGHRRRLKSYLTDKELRQAIAQTRGKRVDLLGFDACEMAMLEIAGELREVASVMVASEGDIPVESWPYEKLLSHLAKKPDLEPTDFARVVVGDYDHAYHATAETKPFAISAVDFASVEALREAIDALSQELLTHLPNARSAIAEARDATYTLRNTDYVDLASLIEELERRLKGDAFSASVRRVRAALDVTRIPNQKGAAAPRPGTLSVYFPTSRTPSPLYLAEYGRLHDTPWAKFLREFFRPARAGLVSTGVHRRDDVAPVRTRRPASSR